MFASGIEGNEYYIKPFSFREFALQSIDFISKNKSELASSLVKLKPILYSSHLDLHHDFNQNKKAIEQLLPFTTDLRCLFRLYLTTGGLSGVINHYFSNRFLDQKDRIEDIIAEISFGMSVVISVS